MAAKKLRRLIVVRDKSPKPTHAGVIMQVDFDIAAHDASEGPDKVINLARVRTAHCISNADTIDPNFIHCLVYRQEIHEV
jgi:hypothetical protein